MSVKKETFTISDVSKISDVNVHTLRYWGAEFDEFLSPRRTKGNHRRYTPGDIQIIMHIKRLVREEMFSLAGAKRWLQKEKK